MTDYFVYLPDRPDSIWGCVATSAGFARVAPGAPYPTHRHPVDHHFTWAKGRVLQCYQMIFVSEGRGVFETDHGARRHAVPAGSVLMLYPGVWHRYTPEAQTGWAEHWLECRGPLFDRALQAGLIDPHRPVLGGALASELPYCFERCHALARHDALAQQDLLSTLGAHMLSAVAGLQHREEHARQPIDDVVERAHSLIALRCHEPLDLRALAAGLGTGYSHFRHAFKARLGLSPKQYQLQVRLLKAQDLLANTDKSVKEIAGILGFESAFHLSKQFKNRCGLAPALWRQRPPGALPA